MFFIDKKISHTKMKSLSGIGLLWLFLLTECRETDAISNRECKIDLVFVIDTSVGIDTCSTDFKQQINFVQDFVSSLDVAKEHTRVAVVTFSEETGEVLLFNNFLTKIQVLQRIGNIQHEHGNATRTYLGLEYVHEVIFDPRNGERPDVIDVVVLLTDGVTNSGSGRYYEEGGKVQTQIEAARLKRMGAYLFAIGVGDQVDSTELNGISSDPDDRFTIMVDSFSELDSDEIKETLYQRACQDIVTTPPPTPPTPLHIVTTPPPTPPMPPPCRDPTTPPPPPRSLRPWLWHLPY